MSQQNVDLVVSLYRAMEQGEYGTVASSTDEDVVWDMTGFGLPGELGKVCHGLAEATAFWVEWLGAWEELEFTSVAPEDHGEHVIIEVHQRVRGRASGVDVEMHYWQAFILRDGKVTASLMAPTRDGALAAWAYAPIPRNGIDRPGL